MTNLYHQVSRIQDAVSGRLRTIRDGHGGCASLWLQLMLNTAGHGFADSLHADTEALAAGDVVGFYQVKYPSALFY